MINQQITLAYPDFHGKKSEIDLDALFDGTSQMYGASLMEIMNANESVYNGTEKLITYLREQWFSGDNAQYYLDMENRIREFAKRFPNAEMIIFNPPSSLSFLEHLLKYLESKEGEPENRRSNAQMERNLLNAYLIINERFNRSKNGIEELRKTDPNEEVYWLSLYKPFQYADLINRDLRELYLIEIYKGILFFEFLEYNPQTKPILQLFIQKYGCQNWKDYLKASTGLAANTIDSVVGRGNNFVEIDHAFPFYATCIRILDTISIPLESVALQEDYLFLRNHPIIRTDENKFQVVYRRFLIEKIFRALYFEMSKLGHDSNIMNRDTFRTLIYTSGYSEQNILYSVLDRIFDKAALRIYGDTMEKIDAQFGASDYITYENGNIFIFESKDILIKKEVKEKLYIPDLRVEFRKKFYKDGTGEKAVLQLARNVKKLLNGEYEKFGFVYDKFRFIYPVIVVHSDAFTILGINQLLKMWFKEACNEVGIDRKDMYKVKPVVLIDSNTLLYFQDRIGSKGTLFNQLIDGYLWKTLIKQGEKNKPRDVTDYQSRYLIPFAYYVENTIKTIKPVKSPEAMRKKIKQILLS
ncbi:hypothetical protein [Algoriphagus antarcticus]|nr:hypothetical protein [Algoriphagus antarcticus]